MGFSTVTLSKNRFFFIAFFDSKDQYAKIEEGVLHGPGIADWY